jgi:hypothetical protein
MSERDAFGREKGEDTLADMGWSSSVTPGTPISTPNPAAPSPTPAPTPILTSLPTPGPTMSAGEPLAPGSGPAAAPGPRASYTRRRRGRMRGIIVPLFIVGIFAIGTGGAVNVFRAGSHALDGFSGSIDAATQNGTSTTKTPSAGSSLLQPAALKAALAKLPAGKIELLKVSPDSINATVIVKGKMHVATVSAGGDVNDIVTPAAGAGNFVKVNSAAPSRIVRTATKRTGRSPGRVDYLVLIHLLGKDEWQLYFHGGMHFSASANGKKVHRVN